MGSEDAAAISAVGRLAAYAFRVRSREHADQRSSERGVALLVVLLVATVLAMLGLGVMALGALETDAARHELAARQAAYAAEAGLGVVKHWFDAPTGAAGAWNVPAPDEVDRAARRVDPDGDGTFVGFASAASPWNVIYREGRDDLFERPYRGGPALALEGDAAGPDVLLSRESSRAQVRSFLDRISRSLFDEGTGRFRLRIDRIAVYAPPTRRIGAVTARLGIASVEVTASAVRIYEGVENDIASARASGVLQEIPYSLPGPLNAGSLDDGSGLDVRWGTVRVTEDAVLGMSPVAATRGGWPWRAVSTRLVQDADRDGTADDTDADGTSDLREWLTLSDATLSDPWFRLLVGGRIAGAPAGVQPYPFDPAAIPGPAYTTDDDRSGLFQQQSATGPSPPDARVFRAAAAAGGSAAHLFRYVAGSDPPLFREAGGAPVSLEEATKGRAGLFYFDTTDGRPAHDGDGDGSFDNLTPPITISDPDWHASGCLFVNARAFAMPASSLPASVEIVPPGEPFADQNADGTCGSDEPYLRLDCPPDLLAPGAACTRIEITSEASGGIPRRPTGQALTAGSTFSGALFVMGDWRGIGGMVRGRIYGAVAVTGGVTVTAGPGADRLQIVYDCRFAHDQWPPPDMTLPRTFWQGRAVPP